ncbi:MAG: serine/threonine protein kinase [Candidatus Schekmanbacteria bacterium]|nr:serine/threonine protein kinase [Candidatus Schekmanbacteria bacterium]
MPVEDPLDPPLHTALDDELAAAARALQAAGLDSIATITPSSDRATVTSPVGATPTATAAATVAGEHRLPALAALPLLDIAPADRAAGGTSEFRVYAPLGSGGMGVVYLARQTTLDRDVAIKKPKADDGSCSSLSALLREAVVTGHLEHPNIIPVHTLGRDESGAPVLVMKKVEGVSWRALLQDPAHPAWPRHQEDRLRWHLGVLIQLCNAVRYAHSRLIVHRDIKPENVMIGAFGEVYLLDWGAGLRLDADSQPRNPGLVGTPAYMAPEMLDAKLGPITTRTDIYLLGATLHEILTGKPRHRTDSLFAALDDALASRPHDYPADVPGELAALCNECCQREPLRRPPAVEDVREALESYLSHRGSCALVSATQKHLQALRALVAGAPAECDNAGAHRHFNACRFGFEQALASWPANPGARDGWREALELMCEMEIACRNPRGAESLLGELDRPPAALAERLTELTAQLAREQQLAADFDFSVGSPYRLRLLTAVVIIGILVVCLGGVALFLGFQPPRGGALLLLPPTVIVVVLSILVARGPNRRMRNRIDRQFSLSLMLYPGAILANRTMAVLSGQEPWRTLVYDCLLCAAISFFGALTLRRRLLLPALLFAASTAVGFRWHGAALQAFAVAVMASLVAMLLAARSDARAARR